MLRHLLPLLALALPVAAQAPRRPAPKPAPKPAVKPAPKSAAPVPRRPVPEVVGVLLYDGKLAEQQALAEAVRDAFRPHAPKVEMRLLHAGTADATPFLKRFDLTRQDAPLFLELDEPGPRARLKRRVPLRPDDDPRRSIRVMLATLKLSVPRVAPPPPGVLVAITPDGGQEERPHLIVAAGPQRIAEGARTLDVAAFASYRLRIPEALRHADLRAVASGAFALDWADEPQGPWKPLLSTRTYFSGTEERFREPLRPVVALDGVLEQLPGNLYVRFRPLGRSAVSLRRLELIARAAAEPSGEGAWLAEVESIREKYGAALPPAATRGTLIGGRLEQDRTLLVADSPFLLTGDLIVPFGRTLKVEPGVAIRAAGRYSIRVQGDLLAPGTAVAPITFGPAVPSQPDDWVGVEFVAPPGHYAGARSRLSHCRFGNAAVALDLRRFGGEVSDCIFDNCLLGARLSDGGKGRIAHSRFSGCQRGLLVDGGAGEVTECTWSACLVALAVNEVHSQMPFRFEQNSIVDSRQAAVFYPRSRSQNPPTLNLPRNHWAGTPEERLFGGGSTAEDIRLDPRLPVPPATVGPAR